MGLTHGKITYMILLFVATFHVSQYVVTAPLCLDPLLCLLSLIRAADLMRLINSMGHTWARCATCLKPEHAAVCGWQTSSTSMQHIFSHPLPTLLTLQIPPRHSFDFLHRFCFLNHFIYSVNPCVFRFCHSSRAGLWQCLFHPSIHYL